MDLVTLTLVLMSVLSLVSTRLCVILHSLNADYRGADKCSKTDSTVKSRMSCDPVKRWLLLDIPCELSFPWP